MRLVGLDHVAMAVTNVERSAAWYIEVLGFERWHSGMWGGTPTFVGTGGTGIALFPKKAKDPDGHDRGILHVAFGATRENFLAARRELLKRGIAIHFEDHGIAHSIYFSDPDG